MSVNGQSVCLILVLWAGNSLCAHRDWCPTGQSYTSWREVASLALVDHFSNDGVMINIAYGVDDLPHRPLLVHCVA